MSRNALRAAIAPTVATAYWAMCAFGFTIADIGLTLAIARKSRDNGHSFDQVIAAAGITATAMTVLTIAGMWAMSAVAEALYRDLDHRYGKAAITARTESSAASQPTTDSGAPSLGAHIDR